MIKAENDLWLDSLKFTVFCVFALYFCEVIHIKITKCALESSAP